MVVSLNSRLESNKEEEKYLQGEISGRLLPREKPPDPGMAR